jgi:hypothetical protein
MTAKFTDVIIERFNPESGHWYDAQGRVVKQVPSAKGDKMCEPTIRHLAKFDLAPGVTSINRQVKAEGLERWKRHQLLLASLTLPRHANEPDDAFAVRVMEDYEAEGAKAADAGTAMHAAINRYYAERELPDTDAACTACHWIDEWLRGMGATDIQGEFGFRCGNLYGGTVDLRFRLGALAGYVDFKTVEDKNVDGYEPYEHHGWQLAGYGAGTGGVPSDRYWNIAIGRQTGKCMAYEWPQDDMRRNFQAFGLLLRLWQIRNRRWLPKTSNGGIPATLNDNAAPADVPAANTQTA